MEGKVVEIKAGTKREKMLPIAERKNYCDHKSVEVDSEARILSCAKCDQMIDPFEYILEIAYKERMIHGYIDQLETERKNLWEERDKLKREVSYLRSTKKKLNK